VLIAKARVGWTANVGMHDASGVLIGSRVLESREEACAELAKAVALIVATTARGFVDTSSTTSTATVAAPPLSVAIARTIFVPTGTIAGETTRETASGTGSVGVIMNAGTMPVVQVGFGISASWHPIELFSVAFGVAALPVRRSGDLGFGLIAGWGEGCYRDRFGPIAWSGCARFYAGAMLAVVYPAEMLIAIRPGSYSWFAAAGVVRGAIDVFSPLFISVELGPVISISQRSFLIDGQMEPALDEPPVAFHGSAGLGLWLD
jgi:hypothetical protein